MLKIPLNNLSEEASPNSALSDTIFILQVAPNQSLQVPQVRGCIFILGILTDFWRITDFSPGSTSYLLYLKRKQRLHEDFSEIRGKDCIGRLKLNLWVKVTASREMTQVYKIPDQCMFRKVLRVLVWEIFISFNIKCVFVCLFVIIIVINCCDFFPPLFKEDLTELWDLRSQVRGWRQVGI